MTSTEFKWILIRAIGVVLAILAILQIPTIVNAISIFLYFLSIESSNETLESMTIATAPQSFFAVLKGVFFAFLAFYFIKRGNLIFRLMSAPIDDKEK